MIYSFWEFQPLLAPPLVGMCIIQTGFINITDEWSNPVSTPQNCPWPTEQRRWAWTWSGESQIAGVGLLTPWEKTEVHWVAPRAVPVSWSGHIWSHMVTFSVTGCMVDDHSSSLLSGGFTHFDLAFIVRLREGQVGKVRSSWDINKWICSNFCHNWSLTWIIYSSFNQDLQDLASDVGGCSGSPICSSILWSSIGNFLPRGPKKQKSQNGRWFIQVHLFRMRLWCRSRPTEVRRHVEHRYHMSIRQTCQTNVCRKARW